MPKDRATEARFNFAGGVNYSASQDTLATNELLLCRNARISADGSVERRTGWNKRHSSAFTAGGSPSNNAVMGVFEWARGIATGGTQLVAIAGAQLWTSDDEGVNWTARGSAGGVMSTTTQADFATMLIGSTSYLFIGSGSDVFTWDGTTLTKRDLVNSVPQGPCMRVFQDRLFMTDLNEPGTLFWSKLGDGTDFRVGGLSDGGFAVVNGDSNEPIIALEVLGNSLLIAQRNRISRFTGTGNNIEILRDTQGVTSAVGPVHNKVSGFLKAHPGSFQRTEQVVEMWTDRGPYIVTEGGVVNIGAKIDSNGLGADEVCWRDHTIPAYVVYHRARQETWYIFRSQADSAAKSAFIYNRRLQCWSGPFQYPTGVTSVCQAVIGGVPQILAGCDDGYVRRLDDDTRARDDGVVGGAYTHTIQLPPFIFPDAGPHNTKSLRSIFLQLQRQNTNTLPVVKVYPDNGSAETLTLVENPSVINAPVNMRYDSNSQGKRFVVEVSGSFETGTSGDDLKLIGVIADGSIMERW